MNIFKVSKKERKKIIKNFLNNISEEELMKKLIEEGLEIDEEIIIKDEYITNQIYKNENICNEFDLHTIRTNHNLFKRIFMKKETNYDNIDMGDAA